MMKKNKNPNDNINNDKNNISKIIDYLSFNDDTLLINSLMLNQNDTVYHKKSKMIIQWIKKTKIQKKKEKIH